jgi:hypothetical protein
LILTAGAVRSRRGNFRNFDEHFQPSPAGHGTAIFMAPFYETAVRLYASRTDAHEDFMRRHVMKGGDITVGILRSISMKGKCVLKNIKNFKEEVEWLEVEEKRL